MRIADATIKNILEKETKTTPDQIAVLVQEAEDSHRPLQDIVLQNNVLSEPKLTKIYATLINVPYIDLDPSQIPSEVLMIVPERIARQYRCVVFQVDEDGTHHLAMDDPDDVQAVNFLQKEIGQALLTYIAPRENILSCLELYGGDVNEKLKDVIDIQREDQAASQQVSEADIAEDSPIAQTVNLLLEYAIRSNASDIHIEPREEHVQIRYRIDGVLKEVNRLPYNVLGALVSRIKILSNLKIDERRVPQDGRFKIKVGGKKYAMRVSTLPITDGEKIVMRILDESNQAVSLKDLGYWGTSYRTLSDAMSESNGIVLVTGPTGSGKSTSLFSVLSILNTPDVNISTIEDPVEYKIIGVNQTQTNAQAGMTFASGLRALLRQDPNIIMVGEIRDGETANLGVQAALTGHLVFSTLHTNNAATCLPRLLDMGIEPFLIASTVRAVVGQRLVRKLCATCKVQYTPDEQEISSVQQTFNLDAAAMKDIEKQVLAAKDDGLGGEVEISVKSGKITTLWKPKEGGCEDCRGVGFRGRVGIYEVLGNSSPIEKLIMSNATSSDIQDQAIKEGMLTMQLDGVVKALRAMTTFEEILRATKE